MATKSPTMCAKCLHALVPTDRRAAVIITVANSRGTTTSSIALCDHCSLSAQLRIKDRELVFDAAPEAIKREPVRDFATINDIAAQACGIGSKL